MYKQAVGWNIALLEEISFTEHRSSRSTRGSRLDLNMESDAGCSRQRSHHLRDVKQDMRMTRRIIKRFINIQQNKCTRENISINIVHHFTAVLIMIGKTIGEQRVK